MFLLHFWSYLCLQVVFVLSVPKHFWSYLCLQAVFVICSPSIFRLTFVFKYSLSYLPPPPPPLAFFVLPFIPRILCFLSHSLVCSPNLLPRSVFVLPFTSKHSLSCPSSQNILCLRSYPAQSIFCLAFYPQRFCLTPYPKQFCLFSPPSIPCLTIYPKNPLSYRLH